MDDRQRADAPEASPDPATWTWSVYSGSPEPVSDGVEHAPTPRPRRGRPWGWAIAGVAAAVAIPVTTRLVTTPADSAAQARPRAAAVIAPDRWSKVDESLTAGLVVVSGGASEADGIVLDSTGLIATSYTEVSGNTLSPPQGLDLRVVPDGHDAVSGTIVHADADADIALVRASESVPTSVARTGTPVHVGDVLTLLDDQGGRLPVVGIGVTVTAIDQTCSRAGSAARPTGFRFSLPVASAEPGAALVRADGTVVGMYYGGDDATHHCAVPIADVLRAARHR